MHWLWYFLVTEFMALLASFWLKIPFVFSNTLSIVKVMLRNSNLTKFDMLTSSSSNMTAPTLKTNEHLKKRTKICIFSSFKKFCIGVWIFLVTKFMALLASFWLKILFVFSNTLSIFKVMLRNQNLTKFDMLTSLSSNMKAQTLLMNEHLKKQTNHVFCLHFAYYNLKVIFFTLYL